MLQNYNYYKTNKNNTVFLLVDLSLIILFILSCVNNIFVIVFYCFLIASCFISIENSLKSMILSAVRTILSNVVAVEISVSILKWILLFVASFYMLFSKFKKDSDKEKFNSIFLNTCIFALYVAVSSFFTASYPITALAKLFAFILMFLAVIKGMQIKGCEIINYLFFVFLVVFVISACVIPFERFAIRNGSFQGITNQPNMFGILCPIFIATIYAFNVLKNKKTLRSIIILAIMLMCYLCKSRTGMFSSLGVVFCYYFFCETKSVYKNILICILLVLITFILLSESGIMTSIIDFIYKGQDKVLSSREGLLENAKNKFFNNMWFGSGFMVPFKENIKNYSLIFDLAVEPGNLFWMLVGDTGIIGLILFVWLIIKIISIGGIKNIYLIVAVLMINMGEMVFFSTNNMSVLLYTLLGYYLSYSNIKK